MIPLASLHTRTGIWISCLLIDHDEKVRLAACAVIDGVEYEMAKHHVSKRALQALADRLTDKKVRISDALYSRCSHSRGQHSML